MSSTTAVVATGEGVNTGVQVGGMDVTPGVQVGGMDVTPGVQVGGRVTAAVLVDVGLPTVAGRVGGG